MKLIRQTIAICMALVMLGTATGFTMSVHLCGSELQHISFLGQAKSCETHVSEMLSCHHEQEQHSQTAKQSCCKDLTIVSELQDSLKGSTLPKILKPDLKFIAVLSSFLIAIIAEHVPHFSKYHQYSPPLIDRDIPVIVQSFLL